MTSHELAKRLLLAPDVPFRLFPWGSEDEVHHFCLIYRGNERHIEPVTLRQHLSRPSRITKPAEQRPPESQKQPVESSL